MLSVLTETPGTTAPMHANILPPTFHASWPPPQGTDTSAPGNARQMAFTISRLIGSFSLLIIPFTREPPLLAARCAAFRCALLNATRQCASNGGADVRAWLGARGTG